MIHRTEFNELKEQLDLLNKQVKNLRKELKEVDSKQYVVRPSTGPRQFLCFTTLKCMVSAD